MNGLQWVFAYGSLINRASRAETCHEDIKAIPAKLKGEKRSWCGVAPQHNLTAVSLVKEPGGACSGVVFEVNDTQLSYVDEREEVGKEHGYRRIRICGNRFIMEDKPKVFDFVYTYVTSNPGHPDDHNPIVQSYVDGILKGCLEYNEEFAEEFILTTGGWEYSWVNDRGNPRYPRFVADDQMAEQIDQLLEETIPSAFRQRE